MLARNKIIELSEARLLWGLYKQTQQILNFVALRWNSWGTVILNVKFTYLSERSFSKDFNLGAVR